MKVGIFFPIDNQLHFDVLQAFALGIKNAGDEPIFCSLIDKEYRNKTFDVAVVFGVRKNAVPASNTRGDVIDRHLAEGKRMIIIERGFVKRVEYYSSGWDSFNGNANFNNINMPSDRWEGLNVELQPWRRSQGKNILLIGQVPWDASVQATDHIAWLTHAVQQIRLYTDRPIVFRSHPLALKHTPMILGTQPSNQSLEEDLNDASAVITFNSNTAVDSVINGCPTLALDRGSMAWPVSHHHFSCLENVLGSTSGEPPVEQWAYDLAYAQWTLAEMAQGLAWQHLIRPLFENEVVSFD